MGYSKAIRIRGRSAILHVVPKPRIVQRKRVLGEPFHARIVVASSSTAPQFDWLVQLAIRGNVDQRCFAKCMVFWYGNETVRLCGGNAGVAVGYVVLWRFVTGVLGRRLAVILIRRRTTTNE